MKILGIETSCDETSAAVVDDGVKVLSNVISSQFEIHHRFGGIVPELASRRHLDNILPVINEAFQDAGVNSGDIDLICVTIGPGLIGALLIGIMAAKGFSYSTGIPLMGINHLEGHLLSVFLTDKKPEFPFLSLLISGGHTNLYRVNGFGDYRLLGKTRDDALGESFDKVARMLGLDYPGGPLLEQLAKKGDTKAIKFPRAFLRNTLDFSFSGMKTSVKQFLFTHKTVLDSEKEKANVAAGFQMAVIDVLKEKILTARKKENLTDVVLGGGVAANKTIQEALSRLGQEEGMRFYFPSSKLCTDNAAMIACAGYYRYMQAEESRRRFDKDYIFKLEAKANLDL